MAVIRVLSLSLLLLLYKLELVEVGGVAVQHAGRQTCSLMTAGSTTGTGVAVYRLWANRLVQCAFLCQQS